MAKPAPHCGPIEQRKSRKPATAGRGRRTATRSRGRYLYIGDIFELFGLLTKNITPSLFRPEAQLIVTNSGLHRDDNDVGRDELTNPVTKPNHLLRSLNHTLHFIPTHLNNYRPLDLHTQLSLMEFEVFLVVEDAFWDKHLGVGECGAMRAGEKTEGQVGLVYHGCGDVGQVRKRT